MSYLLHFGDLLLDGKEPVDDSVDKIHRRCTIAFLLLLSVPLFTKQFAGEPIECFTPTYFTEAQSRYVNSYCWTVSTFYLDQPHPNSQNQESKSSKPRSKYNSKDSAETSNADHNEGDRVHSIDYVDEYELPFVPPPQRNNNNNRIQVKVSYYQWAPMILLAKAVTFYIPFALWKVLSHSRGISLRQLMKRISCLNQMAHTHPDRLSVLREIIDQIHKLVHTTNKPTNVKPILLLVRQSRLFGVFIFIKFLYLLNVLLQFYLLVNFLGDDYLTHGFDILYHLWTKSEWWISPRFPLQTLCSVRAAQQGSLRLYQCHCVLPINLFNEKICSIWWFYIAILLPVTALSVAVWAVRCSTPSRLDFIGRYIAKEEDEDGQLLPFIDYLGCDGIFLLRLIEINHGSCELSVIIRGLYNRLNKRSNPRVTATNTEETEEAEQQENRQLSPPVSALPSPTSLNPFNFPLPSSVSPGSPGSVTREQQNYPKFQRIGGIRRSPLLSTTNPLYFRRTRPARRSLQIHPSSPV